MTVQSTLLLIGALVLYVAHCAYRPYARCVVCKGSPRNSSSRGGSWRLCVFCKGKGQRIRPGRRLYEKLNPKAGKK